MNFSMLTVGLIRNAGGETIRDDERPDAGLPECEVCSSTEGLQPNTEAGHDDGVLCSGCARELGQVAA